MSKIVYEVTSGFDLKNYNFDEIDEFSNIFNSFIQNLEYNFSIYKLNSTFNVEQTMKNISNHFSENKTKNLIIASYLEALNNFKNKKISTIYLVFETNDFKDLDNKINILRSIIKVKKITLNDFEAIKFLTLNKEEYFKDKKSFLEGKEGNKFVASKVWFKNRNLPNFWIQELFYNERISFSIHIQNLNIKEEIKIRKNIKKWTSEVNEEDNIFKQVEEIKVKEAQEDMLLNFLSGEEQIKKANAYVIFEIDNESSFSPSQQVKVLSDQLFRSETSTFKLDGKYLEQVKTLKHFWNIEKEEKYYPMITNSISNMFPFFNTTNFQDDAIFLGTSGMNFPYMYKPWNEKRNNNHYQIIGQSGSGKSVLTKLILIGDIVLNDSKIIILDMHNEYTKLINSFDGKNIDVSKEALNPIKILDYENFDDSQANKIARFFKSFLMESFEKELLIGNTMKNISIISNELKSFLLFKKTQIKKGKEYILEDFLNHLKKNKSKIEIKDYEYILEYFIFGILSEFNNKETLNFKNKAIAFQLNGLSQDVNDPYRKSILKILLFRILDYLKKYRNKDEKILLHIEEASDFFRDEYLLYEIAPWFKDLRKFNVKLGLSHQNITDLINGESINPEMAKVFSNIPTKFIGTLDNLQIQSFNKVLKESNDRELNSSEIDHIEVGVDGIPKTGNFIVTEGRMRNSISVELDDIPHIRDIIDTEIESGEK